ARLRKDEEANRQIRSLFESLLPDGHLQERTLNVSMFLNRYGDYFIDWIYDAVDLDDRGHRIIYL
ncbi:MAG TPA: bacillithiol biosynthesis BshC, partial [Pyrinomonadaceae bacterium]|nr:bacillithiol biosynthesis BshC [Pyrinomonadaceae bacterium]